MVVFFFYLSTAELYFVTKICNIFKIDFTYMQIRQLLLLFLNSESDISDAVKLATVLENDLKSVVNESKEWFVNLKASITKLSSNHQRYSFLSAIRMGDSNLQESNPLDILGSFFPLTSSGITILNKLLGLLQGNLAHCFMPDNFSFQNLANLYIYHLFIKYCCHI